METLYEQLQDMRLKNENLEKENKLLKVEAAQEREDKEDGYCVPGAYRYPPRPISDEMANFLGKKPGTEMERVDVCRGVVKYIRINELRDKENSSIVHPDAILRKLLNLNGDFVLSYTSLQLYLRPHFPDMYPLGPADTLVC